MNKLDLTAMTPEELVEKFVELTLAEDDAELSSQYSKMNTIVVARFALEREMRLRPGDARHLLLPLYQHPHIRVKFNSATATYAVSREEALRMFEQIQSWNIYPYSGDASGRLRAIAEGRFAQDH